MSFLAKFYPKMMCYIFHQNDVRCGQMAKVPPGNILVKNDVTHHYKVEFCNLILFMFKLLINFHN